MKRIAIAPVAAGMLFLGTGAYAQLANCKPETDLYTKREATVLHDRKVPACRAIKEALSWAIKLEAVGSRASCYRDIPNRESVLANFHRQSENLRAGVRRFCGQH